MLLEAIFHSDIKVAIPQIVSCLSDGSFEGRAAALDAVKAFAADCKYLKDNSNQSNTIWSRFSLRCQGYDSTATILPLW